MYKEEYNKWLEFVSEEDKQILLNMNEEEIKDSFTGKLSAKVLLPEPLNPVIPIIVFSMI